MQTCGRISRAESHIPQPFVALHSVVDLTSINKKCCAWRQRPERSSQLRNKSTDSTSTNCLLLRVGGGCDPYPYIDPVFAVYCSSIPPSPIFLHNPPDAPSPATLYSLSTSSTSTFTLNLATYICWPRSSCQVLALRLSRPFPLSLSPRSHRQVPQGYRICLRAGLVPEA